MTEQEAAILHAARETAGAYLAYKNGHKDIKSTERWMRYHEAVVRLTAAVEAEAADA